jgi:hypothetical protein
MRPSRGLPLAWPRALAARRASVLDHKHNRAHDPTVVNPSDPVRDRKIRHCQGKFYTGCLRLRAGQSSTVFAHESPTRSAGFGTENGLYLFALTVPLLVLAKLGGVRRAVAIWPSAMGPYGRSIC